MKALILAGGKGTRFMEESSIKPKPMIEINRKPMLLHIIDHYLLHNVTNFIVLAGYKIEYFFEYFKVDQFNNTTYKKANIKILDTGMETQTGGRIKRALDYVDEEFFLTYGDGLSNVNITKLIKHHRRYKKLATVTAVRPPARFGSLTISNNMVINFAEKSNTSSGWINGGYFVFNRKIIDYIDGDNSALEEKPLKTLANTNNLSAFKHSGFWYPVDTIREKEIVEKMIKDNKLPWVDDK